MGKPTSPVAPEQVVAASAFQKALDIRIEQGWQLGGNACPVLYTDTINGQQVCRDDLWLATTAGLKGASPEAAPAAMEVMDYPPLPQREDRPALNQIPYRVFTEAQMRAFVDADRALRPAATPAAPSAVTDAMIDAYLKANDAYWKRTDELPKSGAKWRNGTPREATRESLLAALAQPAPVQQPLKDHQIAKLVNDLRDVAKEYGQTQQLRERIAGIVRDALAAPVQAGAQQAVADTDYAEGLIDQCAQDWYDWQRNGTDDDRAAWIASRKAAIEYFARALAAPTQAGAGDAKGETA